MFIEESIADYRSYLTGEKNLSKNTVTNYCAHVKDFLQYLQKNEISPTAFDEPAIHQYIAYLADERHCKSATIACNITTIKSYVKFQQIEHIRKDNPVENIQLPKKGRSLPKLISEPLIRLILEVPCESDIREFCEKVMIMLLYASGLRSTELISLKFSNVNFENLQIRVIGKGDKERIVPIAPIAANMLKRYIEKIQELSLGFPNGYLFQDYKKGRPINRQQLFRAIKKYAELAGLTRLPSAHTFRHAFATHMLNHGADLHTVQILLGHSSMNTTEIYTHVATKHLHDVYNSKNPRA